LGLRGLGRHCSLGPHPKKAGPFLVVGISGGVVFLPMVGPGKHLELSPGAPLRWRVGSSRYRVQRSCRHGNANDGLCSRICLPDLRQLIGNESLLVGFYLQQAGELSIWSRDEAGVSHF
jgi:hypothetical protein